MDDPPVAQREYPRLLLKQKWINIFSLYSEIFAEKKIVEKKI